MFEKNPVSSNYEFSELKTFAIFIFITISAGIMHSLKCKGLQHQKKKKSTTFFYKIREIFCFCFINKENPGVIC